MTGFVVDANAAGVSVGAKLVNLGQRCSDTRPLFFDNVVVPAENVLGAEGSGFKVAMSAFDNTRPPVAAGAVGVARRAMDEAYKYAQERTSMGVPIFDHQTIAFMLADMATGIEASRLLLYKSAYEIDQGRSNTMFASMAKVFAAEHCNKVRRAAKISRRYILCYFFSVRVCLLVDSALDSLGGVGRGTDLRWGGLQHGVPRGETSSRRQNLSAL
jgi:acyl-CoA dehydrogenase